MHRFERTLPEGYRAVKEIDAKRAGVGIVFTLLSIIPFFVIIPIFLSRFSLADVYAEDPLASLIAMGSLLVSMIAYIILHELTHGAVYKFLTREKLTFGISWSCAFCGVPHIYCYRRTMLWAVTAPFLVFSCVFVPLFVIGMMGQVLLAFVSGILLALHVGGCCGDLYVTCLLLFVYRDDRLLLCDTGPKQTFYMPENAEK